MSTNPTSSAQRRFDLIPRSGERRLVGATTGHVLGVGLVLGSFLACLVGLAPVVYLAFPLVSVVLAGRLLWYRRDYDFLAYVGWMWLLTPFLRRVIDWKTAYHASSLILIAPAVAGLLAIPVAWGQRRRVDRTIGAVFAFAFVVFLYGACLGLLRNGPSGTAIDVLAVIGPFGAGLFALLAIKDGERLQRTVVELAVWGTIIIGAYGILQFFVAPAWDTKWITDSGILSSGQPEAGQIRVFSTLNTSNPFGEVVAATLLIALAERRVLLRLAAAGLGLASLGLSLVRAAWIALLVAVATLVHAGRIRVQALAGFLVIVVIGLVFFGGSAADTVYTRLSSSVSSGSSDTSVQSRIRFQTQIAGDTIANPVGLGMGSTGTALKLGDAQAANARFTFFDSGIFENGTTYGSVLGFSLVIGLVFGMVAAWRRSRGAPPAVAYCAAAVTLLVVSLIFTNTLKNAPGFLLWVCLAVTARAVHRRRGSATGASAGTSAGSPAAHTGPLPKVKVGTTARS